jgi:hypothetical protein
MKARPFIFVIGPMNDPQQSASNRDHTLVIRDAIAGGIRDLRGLKPEDELPVEIHAPIQDRGADIPNDVFHNIDLADLVVADISLPNPAVFYELAFAHSLGVPTILVKDLSKGEDAFYLKVSRYVGLKEITREAVRQAFAPLLPELFSFLGVSTPSDAARGNLPGGERFTVNPITKFYRNVPLLDISAAAGLALGYFDNFVKPLMEITGDVERFREALARAKHQQKNGPLVVDSITGLIIVKPATLENIRTHMNETIPKVRALSKDIYGEAEGATAGKMLFDCGAKGRRTAHVVVEGVAIDIPRTLYPLRRSKRLERLSKDAASSTKIERVLIARFVDRLIEQAQLESGEIRRERLCIVPISSLAEAVNDLISGKESRFSAIQLYKDSSAC